MVLDADDGLPARRGSQGGPHRACGLDDGAVHAAVHDPVRLSMPIVDVVLEDDFVGAAPNEANAEGIVESTDRAGGSR